MAIFFSTLTKWATMPRTLLTRALPFAWIRDQAGYLKESAGYCTSTIRCELPAFGQSPALSITTGFISMTATVCILESLAIYMSQMIIDLVGPTLRLTLSMKTPESSDVMNVVTALFRRAGLSTVAFISLMIESFSTTRSGKLPFWNHRACSLWMSNPSSNAR